MKPIGTNEEEAEVEEARRGRRCRRRRARCQRRQAEATDDQRPEDREADRRPDRSGATGGAGRRRERRRCGGRHWRRGRAGAARGRTGRRLVLRDAGRAAARAARRGSSARGGVGAARLVDPAGRRRRRRLRRGAAAPACAAPRDGAAIRSGARGRRSGGYLGRTDGGGSGRRSRRGIRPRGAGLLFGIVSRAAEIEPQSLFDRRQSRVVRSFRSWISRHDFASRPYSKQRRPLPGDTSPATRRRSARWGATQTSRQPEIPPTASRRAVGLAKSPVQGGLHPSPLGYPNGTFMAGEQEIGRFHEPSKGPQEHEARVRGARQRRDPEAPRSAKAQRLCGFLGIAPTSRGDPLPALEAEHRWLAG